jgi:DNA-binding CsgD family transcriptional regulator/tetratricopeptide (TPR) repeat protein
MARDTHLEALSAAQFAGRLAPGLIAAAADAARRAPASPTGRRSQDDLLTGLAALLIDGYVQGAPLVQSALARFRDDDLTDEDILRWSWIACRAAAYVWDFDSWQALSSRMVTLARHAGALSVLPLGLPFQMVQCALAGRMDQVKALADEVNAIAEATRLTPVPYGVLQCSAWQGRPAEAIPLIDTVAHQAAARGEGLGVTVAHMSRAILLNGLGRHEEALAAAVAGSEHPEDLVFYNWSLVELIEAATHVRQPERAAEAFERLAVRTSAAGGAWALGVEARCRALISGHDDAERLYRESIALLEQTQVRTETARSYLLLGEWLRRQRRRVEARQVLRRAHDLFTSMGLEAFAERAGRELAATGERARRRTIETNTNLTPRELQVARMASEGLSNPEIGIRLYLSTRTVEYHLRKVFTKLGISSRVQLSNALELSAGEVADR